MYVYHRRPNYAIPISISTYQEKRFEAIADTTSFENNDTTVIVNRDAAASPRHIYIQLFLFILRILQRNIPRVLLQLNRLYGHRMYTRGTA